MGVGGGFEFWVFGCVVLGFSTWRGGTVGLGRCRGFMKLSREWDGGGEGGRERVKVKRGMICGIIRRWNHICEQSFLVESKVLIFV